jgi:hypothetical protein
MQCLLCHPALLMRLDRRHSRQHNCQHSAFTQQHSARKRTCTHPLECLFHASWICAKAFPSCLDMCQRVSNERIQCAQCHSLTSLSSVVARELHDADDDTSDAVEPGSRPTRGQHWSSHGIRYTCVQPYHLSVCDEGGVVM